MVFLIGVVLLFAGLWLIRKSNQRDSVKTQMDSHLQFVRQQTIKTMELQLEFMKQQRAQTEFTILQMKNKLKELPQTSVPTDTVEGSLAAMITTDALARERRAKAALQAVLRGDAVPQARIDEIMESIDKGEDEESVL